MKAAAFVRTTLTSFFVLSMLASAHLFMVVINAAESHFDPARPALGQPARMFSDQSFATELDASLLKLRSPQDREVVMAAQRALATGQTPALRTLPVTRFLVFMTLGLSVCGFFLLWLTSRVKSDAAQSILGIFGGNLLWTGAVEYGLTLGARSLGVGKALGVVDGQLVAIYGEYVLMKHTWGVFALVMVYLVFLESSRCPMFLTWRKRVPTMRGAVVNGRIDNYGPRSAFQYATTVWGFYLLLLWAYDEHVFGVYSLFTKAVLVLALACSLYCVRRLHQQVGWGPAVRYAVGAMIVVWTPIEIIGKWGWMRQPWLMLQPEALCTFFGGLALGTWLLWRGAVKARGRLSAVSTSGMRVPRATSSGTAAQPTAA
jgi:hypothetical protein